MKIELRVLAMLSAAFLSAESSAQEGFVLKTGEGESVLNSILIKVSPEVGSEGSVLLEQTFAKGGRTSLHAHDQGDELIYIVSGKGHARVGDKTQAIGAGDVIFVPRGSTHQITNLEHEEPLRALAFMDSPELVEEVRAIHERITSQPDKPITRDEFAQILERIGGSRLVSQ